MKTNNKVKMIKLVFIGLRIGLTSPRRYCVDGGITAALRLRWGSSQKCTDIGWRFDTG
jgi:hypothetical protein